VVDRQECLDCCERSVRHGRCVSTEISIDEAAGLPGDWVLAGLLAAEEMGLSVLDYFEMAQLAGSDRAVRSVIAMLDDDRGMTPGASCAIYCDQRRRGFDHADSIVWLDFVKDLCASINSDRVT
jgi:hypothetical protein